MSSQLSSDLHAGRNLIGGKEFMTVFNNVQKCGMRINTETKQQMILGQGILAG